MTSLVPPAAVSFVTSMVIWLLLQAEQVSSGWSALLPGIVAPSVTIAALMLREYFQRRKSVVASLDRVSELTSDERKTLQDEYARLRKEEREHMEHVVAGYTRIAEIARKRSHILANGYMALQLAHQNAVQMLLAQGVEVPETLQMRTAAADLLARLEEITEQDVA